jgi:hypothetical protein
MELAGLSLETLDKMLVLNSVEADMLAVYERMMLLEDAPHGTPLRSALRGAVVLVKYRDQRVLMHVDNTFLDGVGAVKMRLSREDGLHGTFTAGIEYLSQRWPDDAEQQAWFDGRVTVPTVSDVERIVAAKREAHRAAGEMRRRLQPPQAAESYAD